MSASHPLKRGLWAKAAASALNLLTLLRDSLVEARHARARLEANLFRGRYRVSSKNDDDLPILH